MEMASTGWSGDRSPATASSAAATQGNLYESGASEWAVAAPVTATVLPGSVWRIQAPALAPAVATNTWVMNWRCPVPGSEIAVVRFGALRTQAPSSLAVSVLGNGHPLWQEGDAAMPVSPAGGRAYAVPLPPGHCNVHLALTQSKDAVAPERVVGWVELEPSQILQVRRDVLDALGHLRLHFRVDERVVPKPLELLPLVAELCSSPIDFARQGRTGSHVHAVPRIHVTKHGDL